jgi:transposase
MRRAIHRLPKTPSQHSSSVRRDPRLPLTNLQGVSPVAQLIRRRGDVVGGRRNLAAFDHLPVIRKVHDLAEADKSCPWCGEMRQKIGEEVSWQVEFIPGRFERIEHVRVKYACTHCEQNAANPQITLEDKPVQPIDKGMAGPGLLAYIVTSKYADYLPGYRLESIFQRNGLEISHVSQSAWCGAVADLLRPLYDLMVRRVLSSHVICTDDAVVCIAANMPRSRPTSRMITPARFPNLPRPNATRWR